ncbi:hypothetical protein VTN77DRAFT_2585 [Rasamsonia byssochlamydoides]|uniref:uncharacterized protein n=1 Tax=Rasamsonia byssochlamydoides TaxID=89139 RepID=UPI0037444160
MASGDRLANGSLHHPERSAEEEDDYEAAAAAASASADAADLDRLLEYPDDVDYYSLLGLSRSPQPTDAQIRSAYRTLTLSFHPDKQPAHLREAAEAHFERIKEAYETLIDPNKRTVYDLQGAEGVKREWSAGGAMGLGGEAERNQVGVKAMSAEEFRRWFVETMKMRERQVLDQLVQARGSITVGLDASSMVSAANDGDYVYLHFPTIRPYKFSIGYSFKAPLPEFRNLWTRDTEEKEDSGNETKDQPPSVGGTEVVLNASINGKLQTPKQRVKFVYEDGTEEPKEVALPLIMVAQKMQLGASINHTIMNVGLRKGLLQKLTPSWLDGATVGCTGLLLPFPSVETSITKAVAPFPGTKPITFSVRSTFARSPVSEPPMIGIYMSRQLGLGKHVYCNWSSGTLAWPMLLHQMLLPLVQIGVDPESALSVPIQTSHFDVGYLSLPKQTKRPEVDEDDEPDVEESLKQGHPAESWHWRVSASPQGGSLTLNYSRNLFSGRVDEPARSEWSLEGYHPITTTADHRAVRLEIQATAGLDGSLGWNIAGTRQVGDFTRVGVGIGVSGRRGLSINISWHRLGQAIHLPVVICPLDLVEAEIATLAVLIPWATYCGIEFGYIRPRERRKRRQAILQRRKELKKLTAKRKAESQQAIELMAEQVHRRQERERAQGGLVIDRAEYGYYPPSDRKVTGERAERHVIDVTIPVAALVDHSQLIIPRETVKFQILGFYDPAPLLPKKLRIWYTFGGRQHMVEASDSEGVSCPMRSHLIAG